MSVFTFFSLFSQIEKNDYHIKSVSDDTFENFWNSVFNEINALHYQVKHDLITIN